MVRADALHALASEQYSTYHGFAAIQHSLNYWLIFGCKHDFISQLLSAPTMQKHVLTELFMHLLALPCNSWGCP